MTAKTKEVINGEWVEVRAQFRAYHSVDLQCWAREIHKGGYATDPEHANKLWDLIKKVGGHQQGPFAAEG